MSKIEMTYRVYFEIFGKKMKTFVRAVGWKEAQEKVKNSIVFHKTEMIKPDEFDQEIKDFLEKFFKK